jgi:hypothetical protein
MGTAGIVRDQQADGDHYQPLPPSSPTSHKASPLFSRPATVSSVATGQDLILSTGKDGSANSARR